MANGYFNFTQPVVAGTRIVSARYNQDLSAIAAAFDVLPESDDLFLGLLGFGPASGSTPNVYSVTIQVGAPLTSYVTGMQVTFLADKTSTGAAQINVNGLGNKTIVSSGAIGLPAGSIIAGSYYTLRYDGTNFQMQTALYALFDQAASSAAASAAAALGYRNDAQAAATSATGSKNAAAASAAAAAVSEANALTYANQALAYRNTAQTAATTATTQATNAGNSASAAASSAADALGYRNTAQTAATNASNSASAAATSETNAANSATAAANSAASISLPLPISSGGSGQTTAAAAFNALAASGGQMGGTLNMNGFSLSNINVMSWISTAAARASLANAGFAQANNITFDIPGANRTMRVIATSVVVAVNAAGSGTVTFSPTFPSQCSSVVAVNGDRNTAGGNINIIGVPLTTGFNFFVENSASVNIRLNYIAIGF